MSRRRCTRFLSVVVMMASFLGAFTIAVPVAAAESCPDVDIVFARGTTDKPGFGIVGRAFIDSLKKKLIGKKITAYPVNYPADWNFSKSTSDGALDANKHIQYVAATCPATKIVLGGMSQGAGVVDLLVIGNRPIWLFKTAPLPDAMVNHISAVAVFGNPVRSKPRLGPLTEISPQYGHMAIDQCAFGDPYCSALGTNMLAHFAYPWNGMVTEAATFAARRVLNKNA